MIPVTTSRLARCCAGNSRFSRNTTVAMPRTWYLSSSRSPRLWIGESVVLDGTTISGIEFQGAWQINDMFTLRGFYELINSKHAPYSTVYCCNPEGFLPEASTITVTDDEGNEHVLNNTGIRDFTGNQLRNSPKHKFSATLTYGVPIASEWGSLDILTILSWRDKKYMDEAELDIYSVRITSAGISAPTGLHRRKPTRLPAGSPICLIWSRYRLMKITA